MLDVYNYFQDKDKQQQTIFHNELIKQIMLLFKLYKFPLMLYKHRRSSSEYPHNQNILQKASFSKLQILAQLETQIVNIIGKKNIKIDSQNDIFTRIQELYINHLQHTSIGMQMLGKFLKAIDKVNAPIRVKLLYFKAHELFILNSQSQQVQLLLKQAFYSNQTNFNKLQIGFHCGLLYLQLMKNKPINQVQNIISNLVISIEQQLQYKHKTGAQRLHKQHKNKMQQTKFIYIGSKDKGNDIKNDIVEPNKQKRLALYKCLLQSYFTASYMTISEAKRFYYITCYQELSSKMIRKFPGINIQKTILNILSNKQYSLKEFSKTIKINKKKEQNQQFRKTTPINFKIQKNSQINLIDRRLSLHNFRRSENKVTSQHEQRIKIYRKNDGQYKQNDDKQAKKYIQRIKRQIKLNIQKRVNNEQKRQTCKQQAEAVIFKEKQDNKEIVLKFDKNVDKTHKPQFKKKKIQLKIRFSHKNQQQINTGRADKVVFASSQNEAMPKRQTLQVSTQTPEKENLLSQQLMANRKACLMNKKQAQSSEMIDMIIKQELQLISNKSHSQIAEISQHSFLDSPIGQSCIVSQYDEQSKTKILNNFEKNKNEDNICSYQQSSDYKYNIKLNNEQLKKSYLLQKQNSTFCKDEVIYQEIQSYMYKLNDHLLYKEDIINHNMLLEFKYSSTYQKEELLSQKQQQQQSSQDNNQLRVTQLEIQQQTNRIQIVENNDKIQTQFKVNQQLIDNQLISAIVNEEIFNSINDNNEDIIQKYICQEEIKAMLEIVIEKMEIDVENINIYKGDDEKQHDSFDHKDLSSQLPSEDIGNQMSLKQLDKNDKNEEKLSSVEESYLPYSKIQIKKDSSAQNVSHLNFMEKLFKNDNISQIKGKDQANKNYQNKFSDLNSIDFSQPTSKIDNTTKKNMIYIRRRSFSNHFDTQQQQKAKRNNKRQKTHNFCNKYDQTCEKESNYLKQFDHWLQPCLKLVQNSLIFEIQYRNSIYQRQLIKTQQILNKDKLYKLIIQTIQQFLQFHTFESEHEGKMVSLKEEIMLSQTQWIKLQQVIEALQFIPQSQILKQIQIIHEQKLYLLSFKINHQLKCIELEEKFQFIMNTIHIFINHSVEHIFQIINPRNIVIRGKQLSFKGLWSFIGNKYIKLKQKCHMVSKNYTFNIYQSVKQEQGLFYNYLISQQDEQKQLKIPMVPQANRHKILSNMQVIIGFCIKIIKDKVTFNAQNINNFLKIL